MASYPLMTINAFTTKPFQGNPAAVLLSQSALTADAMQHIAAQNNLSETAFLVPSKQGDVDFDLCWFTPTAEVPLCGHATLASVHALAQHFGFTNADIRFATQSGVLTARALAGSGDYEISLPAYSQTACEISEEMQALNLPILAAYQGDFLMLVLETAEAVAAYQFQRDAILSLGSEVIITSKGSGAYRTYDFVSRMFAPSIGIDEDPVTGAAHCQLALYWAETLGKKTLKAAQIGPRSGELEVEPKGERVLIRGQAQTYAVGQISV